MRCLSVLLFVFSLLFLNPGTALCEVRALLVACREFLSAPSLGYDSSANLQTLAACLNLSGVKGEHILLEDGTISSPSILSEAAQQAFSGADENDLCLLYLCTHGFPDPYLLLSDGQSEEPLTPRELHALLSPLPGKKMLILDACSSGAFLESSDSPLINAPSITVLTSCGAEERSWYSAGKHLSTGTLSYFVHAFCAGLGLYGHPEADADENGEISPTELLLHLMDTCVLSTPRVSQAFASSPALPVVHSPLPERALTDFSFGPQLLSPDNPEILLSCTVRRDTAIQYRLVEYQNGEWNWPDSSLISGGVAKAGRLSKTLSLQGTEAGDYYALQVYAMEKGYAALCASRLFAIHAPFPNSYSSSYSYEQMPSGTLQIHLASPALITCKLVTPTGKIQSVLCQSHLFLPSRDGYVTLYPDISNFSNEANKNMLWWVAIDQGDGKTISLKSN